MNTTVVKSTTLKSSLGEFELTKTQMLIGRSKNCDIVLDDKSISHYHALLVTDSDGGITIVDLKSVNGIFVSGQKVESESYLNPGDHVAIGKVEFHVHESLSDVAIFNQDMTVEKTEEIIIARSACLDESLVFIDDEYCDLNFSEEVQTIDSLSYFSDLSISKDDYIETEPLDEEFDIDSNKITMNAIEITTTINGNILEQRSFSTKLKKIFVGAKHSSDTILVDLIQDKKVPFLRIDGENVTIAELANFNQETTIFSIVSKDTVILSSGNFQIFIKNVNVASKLLDIPFLYRNKDFFKQTSTVFASIFLPFLMLLLINPDLLKPKEEKKLSIIYKKPTKTQINEKKHTSKKVTDTKKNTGHKKVTNNPKKVQRKKAGQKKKLIAKKAPLKKSKSTKVQKKTTKVAKKKAPVKSYDFKFAANTKSLFNKKVSKVKATNSRSTASTSSSNNSISTSNTKLAGISSSQVGNLGSDSRGGNNSFGSKGLSSRSGRDSSYIQTKTVVLGSMDPDLLRKILQRYLPQFRHCYQEELVNNNETIKGIVDLNFKITSNGSVKGMNIKAKDKRFSKKGINCMKKVLSIISFPSPKGGGTVAVRQPLNFFSDKKS